MKNESTEQFRIEVGQDNIVYLKLGDVNTPERLNALRDWVEKVKQTAIDVYERTGDKILILIDISDLKRYKSRAFSILTDLMQSNQPYVLRSATFGGSPYILVAQEVLLALSGRYNLKAFRTKEEALTWLTSSSD